MVDMTLLNLKKNVVQSKKDYQDSTMKAAKYILISILGIFASILSMIGAAYERGTTISSMLARHIYGGEWLVIIFTICCIVYSIMMVWDSIELHHDYIFNINRYKNYKSKTI